MSVSSPDCKLLEDRNVFSPVRILNNPLGSNHGLAISHLVVAQKTYTEQIQEWDDFKQGSDMTRFAFSVDQSGSRMEREAGGLKY